MEYSLVSKSEQHRWTKDTLPSLSKSQVFNGLSPQGITFDYALPQTWLDIFVKESRLDYYTVLVTTVWVYRDNRNGPVSCCEEVQLKLEELFYKEK